MGKFIKKVIPIDFFKMNFERFETINKNKPHMKEILFHKSTLRHVLHSKSCLYYALAVILLLLPPILALIYIELFGVNVVYWDQWALVLLIEKMYTGSLTLGDLFIQHNEHRLFFPKIIMLLIAHITHYNTLAEMFLSWGLSVVTFLLIFRMYIQHSENSTHNLVKFIPVAWLLFSFRQFENILWGFQIQIYLCILGFVASIYLLEKAKGIDTNFLLALFVSVISSFSFINGLLVWPVGFIYFFLTKKIKGNLFLVWIVTCIFVYGIYFYNWTEPSGHPSIFFMIKNPIIGMTYFFVSIGSPLSFDMDSALINGILLFTMVLLTFLFFIKRVTLIENPKWISFILFSLFSSLSLTIGRSEFGIEQALSSRYVTFTSLGIIGVYLILSDLYDRFDSKKYSIFYGMILSFILVGIIIGYEEGIAAGEKTLDSRELAKSNLVNYSSKSDDDLKSLYPDPNFVRDHVKILEKYRLNVFYAKST